jgi:hypothetical protein
MEFIGTYEEKAKNNYNYSHTQKIPSGDLGVTN